MMHRLHTQRGASLLVVLSFLTMMLLASLAMARLSEVGALVSGNLAYKESAMQASEVGLNEAFAAVKGITNEEADAGSWYKATLQAADSAGLPTGVNFDNMPSVTLGTNSAYKASYFVERLCTGSLPVTDPFNQCLVKQEAVTNGSSKAGRDSIAPPYSTQFRVSVRVTGPKGTTVFVQSLITKG